MRDQHSSGRPWRVSLTLMTPLLLAAVLGAQNPLTDHEAINYLSAPLHDPIARLQQRLESGEARLEYDPARGYLPSLLAALRVPVSSQMLVFSKTSFQARRISPETPRALYFNDNVYIGTVQRGYVLEISSVDPEQGAIFYTLSQQKSENPRFERNEECLQCHYSPRTLGVPGHVVRSVYTASDGFPIFRAGTFDTDHRSPLSERWGGWYVTGSHQPHIHMGNVVLEDEDHPEELDTAAGANLTDLTERLDTSAYLSPHSDIVALMTLEHQTGMHNLITRTNYETRMALHYQKLMSGLLGSPSKELTASTLRRIRGPSDELVQYMLFAEEAPLEGQIEGTSGFAAEFAARGPRDRQGRSLRDFDLTRRMFKYPCSYLIYSEAFEALPSEAKNYIYERLWAVLSGQDKSETFARLSGPDRQAIREILLETKAGLPDYWRPNP